MCSFIVARSHALSLREPADAAWRGVARPVPRRIGRLGILRRGYEKKR